MSHNNTKPNSYDFQKTMTDKLIGIKDIDKRKYISDTIYEVLFSKNLSEFNTQELALLSTLLNSEKEEDSQEIIKTIVSAYPQTRQTIDNLRKYRKLFPISALDKQGNEYIQDIQTNIFDLFDTEKPKNSEIKHLFDKIFWPAFLNKISKNLGEKAYRNCKQSFKIKSYDINNTTLIIETTSKKQYLRFEEYALPFFKQIRNSIKIPELKLTYNINPNGRLTNEIQRQPEDVYKKNKNNNNNFPLNQSMNRNNCHIPNKDDIYEIISKTINNGENYYIQAETGTGKTHLAQALCKKLKEDLPGKKIIYIKASDFQAKYLRAAHIDRNTRKNTSNTYAYYKQLNEFKALFDNTKILIIDDIDQIQGNKTGTQNILTQIINTTGAQVIMTSSLNMSDIIINKKIIIKAEDRKDYALSSIAELFNPTLLKANTIDKHARMTIAESFLNKELFTPPASQGIAKFLAESNIPLSYFKRIFDSISFNTNGNISTNDPNSAFQIIKEMTGHVLRAKPTEIAQAVLDGFNDNQISKYLNNKELGGYPTIENINEIKEIKGKTQNDIDGIVLRSTIYFIKKYYPKRSFGEIGNSFNRKNANILYKEISEYFTENTDLEDYLDSEIKKFINKKYGLI